MFGEAPLAPILRLQSRDKGCGAIARDRANPGNERSGASRRTTQTLGESARASKEMSPLSTAPAIGGAPTILLAILEAAGAPRVTR
jgi:hypothetical protein